MNISGIELTPEESIGFTDFGEQATMSKLMRVAMQANKSIGQLLSEATPEYRHALFTKDLKSFREWEHANCTPTVQPAVSFITDGDRIK